MVTHLKVVPQREPTLKEEILQKIKSIPPPPGILQCPKCGGRGVMTVTNGASIDADGRYKRGTVCHDRICYTCHMHGVWTPMLPETPRVIKERKPRTPKPKIVK